MNNSKKVYMVLTNGFDPDVRVYKEAKYLVSIGFNVTILCWDRKCEYEEKTKEIIEGIELIRFPILSKPGTGMKQVIPFFKFIKKIKKYLSNKDYNYLHCHDFDGIVAGICTKNRKEKTIVFDMHEIYSNYSYAKNSIFKKAFKHILKKSNYIIYVNDEQTKEIEYKEKLVFLPNYPEKEKYVPIEKNKEEKVKINYVGCLRDYDSLSALAEISKENLNLQIGFYGMGIAYDKLVENYKNFPVNIYGKYDGITESGGIYRNTDILYCSYNPQIENWKNAYPVKLYEAIVTLTPIIVTKNTVVGDFVEKNKIGETIIYNNKESIIKSIENINKNYSQYVNNLERIKNDYQWENIVRNIEKIYRREIK